VSVWDELMPEQYTVMITVAEQAYLICVIYGCNLRMNGTQIADAVVAPPISTQEIWSLIPRLAGVPAAEYRRTNGTGAMRAATRG
jgi:hypothetical protein